jgi:hypothetical protein
MQIPLRTVQFRFVIPKQLHAGKFRKNKAEERRVEQQQALLV